MLLGLLVLLTAVLLLLAVPIDLAFVVRRDEELVGRLTVGWLFGLVRIPVRPATSAAASTPLRGNEPPRAKSRRRPRRRRHVWAMLHTEGFPTRVMKLMRRLLGRVHIRRLRLHVRLGLDDPADTGRLWGLLGPLVCAAPAPARASVAIEPDFTGETLWIDGQGKLRIIPLEIIATVVAFALSPVTWRALYALNVRR